MGANLQEVNVYAYNIYIYIYVPFLIGVPGTSYVVAIANPTFPVNWRP